MQVQLEKISKRFGYQWVVREFSNLFSQGSVVGISGPNGSGKSTLIKIISSYLSPTSGKIIYSRNGEMIKIEEAYKYISLVAPYTTLVHEFTLSEQFNFHFQFKEKLFDIEFEEFKEFLLLDIPAEKKVMEFSSGMHQRLQLALSLISNTSLLLFDEPTSYLDESAKIWFMNMLEKYKQERTVIIASNDEYDFGLCDEIKDVMPL